MAPVRLPRWESSAPPTLESTCSAPETLFELDRERNAPDRGELIVTTLVQKALPLLRYRLGDLVRLRPGACACGLDDPRIDVLGRSEMFASILGSKIHHHSIHEKPGTGGPQWTPPDSPGK